MSADLLLGLPIVVGGWLVMGAGRTIQQRDVLQQLIDGLRAGDALEPDSVILPPQLSLDVVAGEFLGPRLGSASLVGRPGDLVGLIGTRQIGRVPRRLWPDRRVESAMVPIGLVPAINADMPLWPALELLEQAGLDGLMVRPQPMVKSEPEPDQERELPALMTRRAASKIVRQRAEEKAARELGGGQAGRPGSGDGADEDDAEEGSKRNGD